MSAHKGSALIFGCNGQLASAIYRSAPAATQAIQIDRQTADITDRATVEAALIEHKPSIVINGAAYNAVDKAESGDASIAFQINSLGPRILASECKKLGIPLVHFSTDLVFDGEKRTPYAESDKTNPISTYGLSKLAGENHVLETSANNYVVRVCRLFGPAPSALQGSAAKPFGNFVLLMLRLAKERGRVRVVDDQVGTPTFTPDLAKAIWQLIGVAPGGLYHITNDGEVTYADYAREIFRITEVECEVEGISTAEYSAPAHRPLYSVLDNTKAQSAGVTPLRSWSDALKDYVDSF